MKKSFIGASMSLSLGLFPSLGHAETAPGDSARYGATESGAIDEIIVTAQKRQERINDVPLSITALTGDQLKSQNVYETADLARIVPGFNYQASPGGTPVYYIRGVGFSDTTPTASPAVTVYLDEVTMPLSDMSRGAVLDLARVEVLKGPQGTLFGGNSTGGAVNYIAAKPTDTFEAGGSIGFGRFAAANIQGYVSGPLGDGVSVRVAGEYRMQGDWQYSATRPGDTLGQKDFLNGRISVAAEPSDNLKLMLTASGWRDRSDTPLPQLVQFSPSLPVAFAPPPLQPVVQAVIDAQNAVAYASTNARITDWLPNLNQRRDDSFYQFSLRGELDLSEHVALTSITAYSHLSLEVPSGLYGAAFPIYSVTDAGSEYFSQELRLAGDISTLRWMVGGNYQHNKARDTFFAGPFVSTNALGLYSSFRMLNNQTITDYAVFASLEAALTDTVTARGSIRYSKQERNHEGCLADAGNGEAAFAFGQVIFPFLNIAAPTNIPPGACVTVDDTTGQVVSGLSPDSLDEDNISWRLGLDWKASPGILLYATVAKGFKGGSYSTLPAVYASQMDPATQESVLAYEVGLKADLLDRKLHVDLAGFYYDYTDKQLLGAVFIPAFGNLTTLVNIPSSRIIGGEIALTALPTDGLRIQLTGSILDTKVLEDPSNPVDPFSQPTSYVGESFPNTPKYQLTADVEQTFPISANASAFVGGSLQYRSSSLGVFGVQNSPLARSLTALPAHTLVDLRAGVRLSDPNISIEVWGKNVTNKYYYTAAYQYNDAFGRFAGMPTTWGARLSFDF